MENIKLVVIDENNQEYNFDFFKTTSFKILVDSKIMNTGNILRISFLEDSDSQEIKECYINYAMELATLKVKSCKVFNLGVLIFNSEKFPSLKFDQCILIDLIKNTSKEVYGRQGISFDLCFIQE